MDATTFAQYSPLFTSGLLSGRNTPERERASRSSATKRRPQELHDSLPLTVNTVSFHAAVHTPSDAASDNAMFLTFMPRRRQTDEGRSFLSLDLAESQSLRSMSLRRKDTVTTRATTFFGKSEPSSPSAGPHATRGMELSFAHFGAPSPTLSQRRRSSRETVYLPSPKPAPSASLPEPPAPLHRRRASNLMLTLSAILSASPSCSPTSPMHRASHSAPSLLVPPVSSSPMISPDRSYFLFSPASPTAPSFLSAQSSAPVPTVEPQSVRPRTPASVPAAVPLKATPSFRSVASANTRLRNRSAALAVLEGRTRSAVRPHNFMSMSDDEDEPEPEPEQEESQNGLLQVLHEEEDVVIPVSTPASSSPTASASSKMAALEASSSASRESSNRTSKELSVTTRSSVSSGSASSSISTPRRSRRSTIESFLSPLTNFIDFRDDDRSTRTWRSFVEISS